MNFEKIESKALITSALLTSALFSTGSFAQETMSSTLEPSKYDNIMRTYDKNKNGELDKSELAQYMASEQNNERRGDKVTVTQKPAIVTINQKPAVDVKQRDPEIEVEQPDPEVVLEKSDPDVELEGNYVEVDQ